jgi:GTPase SAR1 family protein
MTATYIKTFWRNVNGLIVVADCLDSRSLDIAQQWIAIINENVKTSDGTTVPFLFLINKCEGLSQPDSHNNDE